MNDVSRFVLSAFAITCLSIQLLVHGAAAHAQQMPSREYRAPLSAKSQVLPQSLRAPFAPQQRIALSPSVESLKALELDAITSVRTQSKSASTTSLAKALGEKADATPEATAKPYYLGPVLPANAAPLQLQWQPVSGGFVAHLEVSSQGSMGIRAKIALLSILTAHGASIRVISSQGGHAEEVAAQLAYQGSIYTPYTEGDTQQIEIFSHLAYPDASIRVIDVSHYNESLLTGKRSDALPTVRAKAGACTINTLCTTNDAALDAAIAERKRSTARINYRSGAGNFLCSGTLLNTDSFPTPYFLTANHCISTVAEAQSIQSIWFREASSCEIGNATDNNTFLAGQVNVSGGMTLVFTNKMTDATLLRMNTAPPDGVSFSGWDASLLPLNTPVVSVSHPGGAPSKWARGTIGTINAAGAATGFPQIRLFGYPQDMYAVFFTEGIIEGGSSGSGIFTLSNNGSLLLRGVLSSSTLRNSTALSCSNRNENANYGRLEIFYPQIAPIVENRAFPADDFPNQPSSSGAILPLNGELDAALSYVGDIDSYRIVIAQPGRLTVGSRGTFDTVGVLLRSDGDCIPSTTNPDSCNNDATNDDASSTDTNFLINRIAVTPGTYYLNVAMWDPNAIAVGGLKIYATFTPDSQPQTLSLTRTGSGGGAVSSSPVGVTCGATCASDFNSGVVVTLTASADPNSFFAGWTGCTTITTTSCQVTMDQAKNVTATFNALPLQRALSRRGVVDIDGNSTSELLLRDSNAAAIFVGRFTNNQFVWTNTADPGSDFRLLGALDFAGTGRSDLAMFRDAAATLNANGQGTTQFWSGFNSATTSALNNVRPAWDVQAIGDLDGDGFGDLVWRFRGMSPNVDDQGVSFIWFTNGTNVTQVRKRGGAPLTWTLLGAADLNYDNAADMIYISPANAMRALMATPLRTCANFVGGNIPTGFTALRLADYAGNGPAGVLIRNASSGEVRIIALDATGLALPPFTGDPDNLLASCTSSTLSLGQSISLVGTTDPAWTYLGSGDFNGDGRVDVAWRRPDGTITVWLMAANGTIQTTINNAGTAPANTVAFPLQ